MRVWLLAGQSNMQGIAPLDECRRDAVDQRVLVFSSAGRWTEAREPLHRLWESYTPVNQSLMRPGLAPEDASLSDADLAERERRTAGVGAGLGVSFATTLATLTGEQIGLVPCAHGGTTLEQWSPSYGGTGPKSLDTLYGAMLDRTERALAHPDTELAGVLWYQGESDSTPVRSADYGSRLEAWIHELRRDLDHPDLPIYVVQLGRFAGAVDPGDLTERSWSAIREAQREVVREAPRVGMVSAVDLGLSDPIHIGRAGLLRLGRRLAVLAAEASTGPDVSGVEFVGPGVNGHLVVRVQCSGVRGAWKSLEYAPGFVLTEADGTPISRLRVVHAHPAADDTSAVLLVTSPLAREELAGTYVSYGQGFDPVCLLVDESDMPLPAFAAQPIGGL